jgi:hypothetical protein
LRLYRRANPDGNPRQLTSEAPATPYGPAQATVLAPTVFGEVRACRLTARAYASASDRLTPTNVNSPPNGSDGTAATETARRYVAQLANGQIRLIAENDVLARGSTHVHAFLCACGCTKMVALPLVVHDASGAWREGHKRT